MSEVKPPENLWAFPSQPPPGVIGGDRAEGMTLRDYIATHALEGMLAGGMFREMLNAYRGFRDAGTVPDAQHQEILDTVKTVMVEDAYQFSDAMLRERTKPGLS